MSTHEYVKPSKSHDQAVSVFGPLVQQTKRSSGMSRGRRAVDEVSGNQAEKHLGHNFIKIPVYAATPTAVLPGITQVLSPASPVVQPSAPAPTAEPAASTLKPSLSLSNDAYVDSGDTSHKRIRFDVTVPIPLDDSKIVLVNKIEGQGKYADGTFWKVRMYGNLVDANFPTIQVDSVDTDPVYWSDSSGRWHYNRTSDGFYATDNPGPPDYKFNKGDEAKLKFKIGVYWLDEVPTTTSGSISALPIEEKSWQYSVRADPVTGALSHPTL
jgi:hypothetical protein